ncbi:MAG: COQ9 family protein [Rhodospirillaceae bacterium]|nr:COQ9 family protein [Rhodospirillaceae bacterium]|tara:strand:- start:10579 stop:11229 length:651 start_codon:yes stop_codon:yes gene_type:complete
MTKNSESRIEQKDNVLLAILPHVAFDGWTDGALKSAAVDAGIDHVEIKRFFPGGVQEIAAYFCDWTDRQMLAAMAEQDISNLRLRDRVAMAVRCRLEALAPYRETERRTIAFLSLPGNVPVGVKALYNTVDRIWYAVGDKSADFSFYTKRALLAAVVSTTTLYWLNDDSDERHESWEFLDRRIADVMKIPTLRGRIEKVASKLPDPFRILRATRAR